MLVCRVYSVGDFVSVGCTVWTILSWARFVGLYVSLLNIQCGYGYLGQDLWDCELVWGVQCGYFCPCTHCLWLALTACCMVMYIVAVFCPYTHCL